MTPEAIVLAILSLFPYMSGNNRQCIEHNQARIVQQLRESQVPIEPNAPTPPLELLAAVAFMETHLGCDAHEGGNWGAPIDKYHRHTAGTHMSAVRVLVHGYQRCGTWEGSVLRFRTGLCNPARQSSSDVIRRIGPRYLRRVQSLVTRIRSHRSGA